jgi:hypothetical protein
MEKASKKNKVLKRMGRTGTFALMLSLYGVGIGAAEASALYFDFNQNHTSSTNDASVFLFGAANQTATVSNLDGFNQTVTLGSDGFYNLFLPSAAQQSGTGIKTSGFKVESAQNIAGYFVNRKSYTTDMTYIFDETALGNNYVVASQGNGFDEGSQIAVHAIQDNTTITLNPKSGTPITVTLNAGETYKYAGGTVDLTGSKVSSDKAVAVFSGHACAQVPVGTTYCDTLIEQMIPVKNLSKNYLVTASQGADLSGSDIVRVVASADGTLVSRDGIVVATLNEGEFYEFSLASNSGSQITSSEPVLVAQYLKGGQGALTDPAMAIVPGSDTWLDEYRLSTPTGTQDFTLDYASIIMNSTDLFSLELNGSTVDTSSFTTIAGTDYSRGNIALPDGLFDLTADSSFLVMLGGGQQADSYYTFGGATFAPGISPPVPPSNIPEPTVFSLLGIGLVGLLAVRRRRKV